MPTKGVVTKCPAPRLRYGRCVEVLACVVHCMFECVLAAGRIALLYMGTLRMGTGVVVLELRMSVPPSPLLYILVVCVCECVCVCVYVSVCVCGCSDISRLWTCRVQG